MTDPAILPINTPCKNCCFAVYQDKTQTGCRLGRIEPFSAQGAVVEAFDEDREFFVINRICNAYRSTESDFAKEVHPDHQPDTIRDLIKLRMDVILVVTTDTQDVHRSLKSCEDQELKPSKVIVVNNSDQKPSAIIRTLRGFDGQLNWHFVDVRERGKDNQRVGRDRCVDIAMQHVSGNYYMVLSAGRVISSNALFIKQIDQALNDRLARFSVLLPYETGECLVVQTDLHKHPLFNGNVPMVVESDDGPLLLGNVMEKVQYFAKTQDKEYMVGRVGDIV